jgi:DNA polymerase-3 subunit epsilon
MWGLPFNLDWRRRWLLRRVPAGPLQDFLAQPFPLPTLDYRGVEYLAVDLETTGLDAKVDDILSVGSVAIRGNRIDLSTAQHRLVRPTQAIPESSAIIHQITDDQAAQGEPLETVLRDLLGALKGKVLVAHHAAVELSFLGLACKRLYGTPLLVPAIDTQLIARRWLDLRQQPIKPGSLRLHALGDQFNLPRYVAHNALSDALAAAEIFLAQAAYRDRGRGCALREFLN